MSTPPKRRPALPISLGVAWGIWLLAALYLLKISRIFHGVMKLLGPLTYALMLICPLIALILGVRRIRHGERSALAWFSAVSGGLMVVAFIGVIAVPMTVKARERAAIKAAGSRPLPPDGGRPVFPGAEGFGTRTAAGRGGRVRFVTSLADDGPGTLREALNQPFPRTILFRVGGIIELKKHSISSIRVSPWRASPRRATASSSRMRASM